MKILHVITSLETGGAEKLLVDLLPRFMQSADITVDLCVFNGIHTPFRKEIESKGIHVIDFGEGNSVYNPKNISSLRKLSQNYDIIHTHNTSPQFFTAIANKGCKCRLVTTEHSTNNRRRKWPLFKYIDKWMFNQYDKVIGIAERASENLGKYIPTCRAEIITINNGVDVKAFAEASASDYLEQLAPGSKKILMVARLRWEKDQDTLIQAMTNLPEEFHLFLAGDGYRQDDLEKLTASLSLSKRVHFLGNRTDVPNLLKAADYIVMSSHFEGLSL